MVFFRSRALFGGREPRAGAAVAAATQYFYGSGTSLDHKYRNYTEKEGLAKIKGRGRRSPLRCDERNFREKKKYEEENPRYLRPFQAESQSLKNQLGNRSLPTDANHHLPAIFETTNDNNAVANVAGHFSNKACEQDRSWPWNTWLGLPIKNVYSIQLLLVESPHETDPVSGGPMINAGCCDGSSNSGGHRILLGKHLSKGLFPGRRTGLIKLLSAAETEEIEHFNMRRQQQLATMNYDDDTKKGDREMRRRLAANVNLPPSSVGAIPAADVILPPPLYHTDLQCAAVFDINHDSLILKNSENDSSSSSSSSENVEMILSAEGPARNHPRFPQQRIAKKTPTELAHAFAVECISHLWRLKDFDKTNTGIFDVSRSAEHLISPAGVFEFFELDRPGERNVELVFVVDIRQWGLSFDSAFDDSRVVGPNNVRTSNSNDGSAVTVSGLTTSTDVCKLLFPDGLTGQNDDDRFFMGEWAVFNFESIPYANMPADDRVWF